MTPLRMFRSAAILLFFLAPAFAQVLEFDSNGLHYRSLTRGSVTIMFAPIATRILGYSIVQVSISNGSPVTWSFQPEDFRFERDGGGSIQALPAGTVVGNVLNNASH